MGRTDPNPRLSAGAVGGCGHNTHIDEHVLQEVPLNGAVLKTRCTRESCRSLSRNRIERYNMRSCTTCTGWVPRDEHFCLLVN